MGKYLLVISCSKSKDKSKGKLPALVRYTGICYKTLNKLKRENNLSKSLDIVIISAKYGFLKSDDLIEYYDQKIDNRIAIILNKQVVSEFKKYLKGKRYKEIFINLGKEYMVALKGFEKFVPPSTKIIIAKGRIGEKIRQMKNWLLSIKCK